ncbi:peptidyl-Lys metalloendopeptidase [Ganoderma leucocontextum]|nr:peptidyl-Lys metalloendopeptidase [Ganoderma leucocontextum]
MLFVRVVAAPGLSLKVTGPDAVDGVENMKVITTLTNTGDETLKLLNDPNSVLHTLPANTFTITTDDGASPSFTGVMASTTDPAASTVLAPGATAYNFTNTGHNKYTVKASNSFYAVNSNNEVSTISANAEAHSATLTSHSGNLAVARRPGLIRKRANFNGCSADQQVTLTAAAFDAYDYATTAWSYLDSFHEETPRYSTWFGAHFQNIAGNDFVTGFRYDCTCTDADAFAYVYPDEFGTVFLCGAFWDAAAVGADSKAGTLVHEASHFTANGGTQDYAYGQADAQALAQNDPEHHEYFAENNPEQA